MTNVKILDCTLRDGGFVNNWDFGRIGIYNIFMRLVSSGIEIVEVGFLNKDYPFDIGRSIMPRSKHLSQVFDIKTRKKPILVAMVIMGECPIENIDLQEESLVDGIRVVFKNTAIDEGLKFASECKNRGYRIFLQPASVTDYTEEAMIDLAAKANKIEPSAVYIVDTYGLMHKEKVFYYFNILDKNLSPDIAIGFHSHNNLQMSYSSAIDLLDIETEREVIFDSSLLGMGKGSGNLNTELIADYLNKYHGKQYDLMQILEAIDLEILKIKNLYDWGYSFDGFIAASNDCHPQYVHYLTSTKTLSIKSINSILSRLSGVKTVFDKEQIERLYYEFQSKEIDDAETRAALKPEFVRKHILLLAPGSSLNAEADKIHEFIEKEQPVVVAINHNPLDYPVDLYFINNAKRYSQMAEFLEQNQSTSILVTSNITPANTSSVKSLNYSSLLVPGDEKVISANAALMFFNLLKQLEIPKVYIAGFDGFSKKSSENYVESYLSYNTNDDIDIQNTLISQAVAQFRKHLAIVLLTKTNYDI
jgi:4-hydroxy 2-oxovalerate aldolase